MSETKQLTLRQKNLAWRIFAYPVHLMLKSKCAKKESEIQELTEVIQRCSAVGRRSGKTVMTHAMLSYSIIKILKNERFIYLWG